MNARDTVMSHKERRVLKDTWIVNPFRDKKERWLESIVLDIAQIQAEISFKAGIQHAMNSLLIVEDGKPSYIVGRQAGIKEVVEWIESQRVAGVTFIEGIGVGIPISERAFMDRKKEWGL